MVRNRCGRIVSMICKLGIGNIWIPPQLILVIGGFNQHGVAYVGVSLLFSPMTLKSFPHLSWDLHETILAQFGKM